MKVCVINSLYPPYTRGGAEIVAQRDIAKHLEIGDDVFVITVAPWRGLKSLCYKLEKRGEARIYRFYPLNIFSFIDINSKSFITRAIWHLIDLFNLHSYFCFRKILKKERPDLVITHNLKGLGYLGWKAIRSLNLRNTHVLHDVQLVEPSGLMQKGREKNRRLYSALCRSLIGSPTKVISPSKWLLDLYISRGFFSQSEKDVDLAFGALPEVKKLNLMPQKDKIKLIYASQVESSRGIFTLLDALEQLPKEKWQLEIMNNGSALSEVKTRIGNSNNFVLNGTWEADRIKEADFLVLPSLVYENSPTIIPISLSLDVPVIASDIGGVGEMVVPGINGYLFEPGKVKSLIEILKQVL